MLTKCYTCSEHAKTLIAHNMLLDWLAYYYILVHQHYLLGAEVEQNQKTHLQAQQKLQPMKKKYVNQCCSWVSVIAHSINVIMGDDGHLSFAKIVPFLQLCHIFLIRFKKQPCSNLYQRKQLMLLERGNHVEEKSINFKTICCFALCSSVIHFFD